MVLRVKRVEPLIGSWFASGTWGKCYSTRACMSLQYKIVSHSDGRCVLSTPAVPSASKERGARRLKLVFLVFRMEMFWEVDFC